jgi:predicted phosphodiesterase
MKIQYISDIHLELQKKIPKIIPVANILVLAGDIGYPDTNIYKEFLKEMNKLFKKVFLITGNHEYYSSNSMEEVENSIEKTLEIYNLKNITFLNSSYEDYEGIRFIGTTLWTNIKNPSNTINDMNIIKDFSVELNNELHSVQKEFLEESLQESPLPIVIITHHLPSYTLIHKEFQTDSWNKYNQNFASDCDSLIKPPIKLWIYGHTHKENNSVINSVHCVCNPIGYPSEIWNKNIKKSIKEKLEKYILLV